MNEKPIIGAEIASATRLQELEKQYRRAGLKWKIILSIPALWIIGGLIAKVVDETWIWEALVGWCLLTTFMAGVFLLYQVPAAADVVHKYSLEVLPGIFRQFGAQEVRVAKRHDLSMKVFLESGLYYDKYSTISREDSIQGTLHGNNFGMYEVAVQVGSSLMTGRPGATRPVHTNQFYGWFIILNTPMHNGFHFITPRKRFNTGESDDWLMKTIAHWENDEQLEKITTGTPSFDELFFLNSDQPSVLLSLLNTSAKEYLVQQAQSARNAFAISIQRSCVYVLIGHERAEFRVAPESNFIGNIPESLAEDVGWYVQFINNLRKMSAGSVHR